MEQFLETLWVVWRWLTADVTHWGGTILVILAIMIIYTICRPRKPWVPPPGYDPAYDDGQWW
jgi:hypothetical protein